MDIILSLVDFILHIDVHLSQIIKDYGTWTYAVLFLIVFCETGFVVTPFLPGDSLLFAAGTFAALGSMDVTLLMMVLAVAAILGDTVNYWIGWWTGPGIFSKDTGRFLRKAHLERAHWFYTKHGGKTIVLARFVPIIRTFAPFVAGIGRMNYLRFIAYNVAGGLLWVGMFVMAGFWFGNIPAVRQRFTLVILGIIVISVLPMVYEIVRARTSTPGGGQFPDKS